MKLKNAFNILTGFVIILILYIIIPKSLDKALITTQLLSGSTFKMTVSEIWISLGVLALFVEMVKSAQLSVRTTLESALSVLVTICYVIAFITVKKGGNSTFFILMLLSGVDSLAGFVIALGAARRDIAVN